MNKFLSYIISFSLMLVWVSNPILASDIDEKILKEAKKKSTEKLLELAEENTHRNFDLAITYTNIAEKKARIEKDNKTIFDAIKQRGRIYEFNNRLLEALDIYKEGEILANENDNDKQRLSIYTDIAITQRRLSNYSDCRKYHRDALAIAERIGDQQGIENSYYGLATLHKNLASYDKALEFYNKVVQSTEKTGETYRMLNTRQYVASTYAEAGQNDLALKEIKETFEEAIEQGDSLLIGTVAFDYGKILSNDGDIKGALKKYEYSLAFFKALNHKPLIARSLFYIGDTYAQLEDYEKAGQFFETCQSYKKYMSIKSLSDLQYRMGALYRNLKNYGFSEKSYTEGLQIAEDNNLKELCQKSHHGLYELYESQNKIKKALFHLDKSASFKDSLLTEGKLKTIRQLNFQEEVRASDEQIDELKVKQRNIILFSSLGGLALVVGFLSFVLINNNRSNAKLKSKNEEIRNQNVKLRESNEVLHQFTYVAAHDLKEPVRNIGSFISLLKRRYGKEFNEEANEYMNFVMQGANRINTLLNDLENYTSISLQQPVEEITNPANTLKRIKELSEYELTEEHIVVNNILPKVKMAEKHLRILLKELIGNAIKFRSEDTPKMELSAVEQDNFILFKLKDNGMGIRQEHESKVFNLFYKEEKNWEKNGTGIGLTICKNIVDKYDGEIWFKTNEGKGVTFYMTLPKA